MKKKYLLRILVLIFPLVFYAQSDFDCSTLNPVIENTEINICEPGANVTLKAQTNTGNQIYWYESEKSMDPIESGAFFDIGYIISDSEYWVTEAYEEYGTKKYGQGMKTYSGENITEILRNWGVVFEVESSFILNEVDVYSAGLGGDITIELQDETGLMIESKKINVPDGGTKATPIKTTIELNFEILKKGVYYLIYTQGNVNLNVSIDPGFPFEIGKSGKIIDAYQEGIRAHQKFYAFFYNWTITPLEIICESERTKVDIKVNDDYPQTPKIEEVFVLCGNRDFTLGDVEIENTNKLQWYDQEGSNLLEDTIIEEEIPYLFVNVSPGGCISDFVEVYFTFQENSNVPKAETSQSFEEGSNADLTSLEVEGENLRWYADEDKAEELPEDTLLEDGMTYYVSQTLEEHCESDLIGITVTETLGVADVYFEGLKYNNPVQDILYLSNDVEIESISVYDLSGRQLSIAAGKHSSTELRMDLSGLSAGVYFFNLYVNEGAKMIKIVKQ